MVFNSNVIANRIKKFRENSQLTQEQLAEKVGLSRNALSNLECGNNKLSYKTLINLCDVLEICPCELICGVDHKTMDQNIADLIKHMDDEEKEFVYHMILSYKSYRDELKRKS